MVLSADVYKPFQFFLFTFLGTWIPGFFAAYFSYKKGMEKLQLIALSAFCIPFIVAFIMIYLSGDQVLIKDFWHRVFYFKVKLSSLAVIVLLMPVVVYLATAISLLFGKSSDQFSLASAYNVMKGWQILSMLIPFVLAPLFEELGWRGYGVDSLRANFNLFTTSLLFGFLWAIWHLPWFFIKGYYHHELWNQGGIYVINFFVSILPVAFLLNWIYYTNNRGIPAIILFHSMLNIFSTIFKTEQFTKCIITLLLMLAAAIVVIKNRSLFFS